MEGVVHKDITRDAQKIGKLKRNRKTEQSPCKVCGGKGTGLHYGANTCESCKIFFRRSLPKHAEYQCRNDVRCHIQPVKRNVCPYCRFQKCLQVGMSLDGLRRHKKNESTMTSGPLVPMTPPTAQTQQLLREERCRPSLPGMVLTLCNARAKYSFIWDNLEEQFWTHRVKYVRQNPMQSCLWEDVLHALESGHQRAQWVTLAFVDNLRVMRKLIRYVKCIPGYKDLVLDDQIILLQGASCDLIRINRFHILEDSTFDADDLRRMIGDVEALKLLAMARKFLDLRLRREEVAVMSAMVLFNNARPNLRYPDRVHALFTQFSTTLQWLLKRNHPEDPLMYCKTYDLVMDFRKLAPLQSDFYAKVVELSDRKSLHVPQLVRELATVI